MLRLLAIIVTLFALAFGGWSLLWGAAARKTGQVLDAWIENESQLGRNWTCARRRIGGYPLDIQVSCADLQFRGQMFAENFAGSLSGFNATATVLQPDRVKLRLDPPFDGTTPDGDIDFQLGWSGLNVLIEGRPTALTRLSVDGDNSAVKGSAGALGKLDARAKTLRAFVAPSSGAAAALDFQIAVNGVTAPSITGPLGLEAPIDATIGGTIFLADTAGGGGPAQRIERWRVGGGRVEVKTLQLTSGATKLSASGVLDLDEAHRPRGKLDAVFEGLNPVLRRLGVDPQIVAASSLLTSFLHNAPGKQPDAPGTIRLPLRLGDGRVSIGPIRTPLTLSPLY